MNADGQENYAAREALGVFLRADDLESAFDGLEQAGFGRAEISIMAAQETVAQKLGHRFESVRSLEEEGRVPQSTFVSKYEFAEARAAAFGLPFYIGAVGSAFAVVATGGALVTVIAAAVGGGLVGGGVGLLIAKAIGEHHAKTLEDNLRSGGLLLWVRIKDETQERKAIEIMQAVGGTDVHAHTIERNWGLQDVPLHDVQPDPFLEKRSDR
jgi:hypothetical protein